MSMTIVNSLRVIAAKSLQQEYDQEFTEAFATLVRAAVVYFFGPQLYGESEGDDVSAEIASAAAEVLAACGQPVELNAASAVGGGRDLLKKAILAIAQQAGNVDYLKLLALLLA